MFTCNVYGFTHFKLEKHYFDLHFVVSRIYAVVPSKPLAVLANPRLFRDSRRSVFKSPPPPHLAAFSLLSPLVNFKDWPPEGAFRKEKA
jgi:hypothetical protein